MLGCDTARYTVQRALSNTNCKVIQAMRTIGMTNATLTFDFPLAIKLADKVRVGEGTKWNACPDTQAFIGGMT